MVNKMWQTTRMTNTRTYKEIDSRHTMICIDDVEAVIIEDNLVRFWINGGAYESDYFDTEEEVLNFLNTIMGWEVKQ